MMLYLVIGENYFPGQSLTWGFVGLFKDYNKAWACPLLQWGSRKVVEIETDLIETETEGDGDKKPSWLTPSKRTVIVDASYTISK